VELSQMTMFAFTFFTSVRVVSYVPQIARVVADTNGASAISYSTWALWTAAHVATAAYAAVNLGDAFLAGFSILYALCCLIVIAVTMVKRRSATDSNLCAQRETIVKAVHREVDMAAAALNRCERPSYSFESNLAGAANRLFWLDLRRALS